MICEPCGRDVSARGMGRHLTSHGIRNRRYRDTRQETPLSPHPDADYSWMANAECKRTTGLDWGAGGRGDERCKDICRTCPVIGTCLDWAFAHQEAGTWGGMSEAERMQMRRQAKRAS